MRTTILFLMALSLAITAHAFTFTRWQVTVNELKQTNPVMVNNNVFWRQWYSGSLSNIWAQDLLTKLEQPVVERLSEKTPAAASGNYLLYNESIEGGINQYETGLYNIATGEDQLIATGPESQVAQDIWGNRVIYSVGDTHWPDMYLYDINTGATRLLVTEAIRPRIWENLIVYIKSYGFGYSTINSYNLENGEITQVPSINDHNQTLPDIYKDKVVWSGLNDNLGVFYKNLTTGEERKISDRGAMPVIWGDFIAWNQLDDNGEYHIYAYDLTTSETQKLSDSTSNTGGWEPYGAPYICDDTVLWTSGGTNGYGNIFAAKLQSDNVTISGYVALLDFKGNMTSVPIVVELRKHGGTTTTTTINLDSGGGFTLSDVPIGEYDIAFKASHWLRDTLANISVNSNVYNLEVSLTNGDVDGDNNIDAADLDAFKGKKQLRPEADLNGDGQTNGQDMKIVRTNLGMVGDL